MRAPWRLAAGVAALSAALAGCGASLQSLPKIGGSVPGGYPVHALFADVLNLPVGAQVRIGADVVGEVTAITARDFAADLTLTLKRSTHLPVGTTAEVRFDNPLGDEYVLLAPPATASAATFVAAGGTLPQRDTSTAPSVEDTFGALSLVLNGGGIGQLQTIIHELNGTFAGRQPQIRQLLGDIDTATTSLAQGHTAVDDALAAVSTLSTQLNAGGGTITAGIDAAAPAVATLAGANQDLSDLLSALQHLGTVGTQVAQQSGAAAAADAHALLPVVQQLEAVDQQLAPELATVAQFEATTPKVAPGDYLQVAVTANVVLPPGPSTATPGAAGPTTASAGGVPAGAGAVAQLLAGGLL